jgi:hypothetical protein
VQTVPSRRDVLLGATVLLAATSVPALRSGAPHEAAAPLVTTSGWDLTYTGGKLSVSCTVNPMEASGVITDLCVEAVHPGDSRMQYCAASSSVGAAGTGPGTGLQGIASTRRFDPAVHGRTVTARVSGLVKTGEGSRPFSLQRDFDVAADTSAVASVS